MIKILTKPITLYNGVVIGKVGGVLQIMFITQKTYIDPSTYDDKKVLYLMEV